MMLRRRSATAAATSTVAWAAGMLIPSNLSGGTVSCAAPIASFTAARFQSSDASGASSRRPVRNPAAALARARQSGTLPPAVDFVHWNDNDVASGHLLRVLHKENFVLLDYHRQTRLTSEEGNKANRIVTVTIPVVYVARLLGVLENKMDQVEIQSRFTNIVFKAKEGAAGHYVITGTSTWQSGAASGAESDAASTESGENGEQTLNWNVEFDIPEALMLHRFLSQSLHYNKGFGRTSN